MAHLFTNKITKIQSQKSSLPLWIIAEKLSLKKNQTTITWEESLRTYSTEMVLNTITSTIGTYKINKEKGVFKVQILQLEKA